MRKIVGLVSLLVILLIIISGSVACKSSSSPASDEGAIRDYADPATETTLQGLSENNLAKYTQNANLEFKAAVTQEILDERGNQLGNYDSKEFLRFEEQEGYIIVHYKATYTESEWESYEVGIRMVFDKDHLVADQGFE